MTPGYTLGTVREIDQNCPPGTGAGIQCQTLAVTCPELPEIQVSLRLRQPTTASVRGTIVFSSGGGGTGFYNAVDLYDTLQGMGFQIVDRAWAGTWYSDNKGIRKGACRYATLATWVRNNLHTSGAFCGTGNSGGAAEVGHAMATYGRGAIFDHVMPTGGPAVARLDYACNGANNAAWLAQCETLIPRDIWQCTPLPSCTLGGDAGGVCSALGGTPDDTQLHNDSVLAPDALMSYFKTRMDFIEGLQDCQISPVMGSLFHSTVTSNKSMQYVPETPHSVASAVNGRAAMVAMFDQQCTVRH